MQAGPRLYVAVLKGRKKQEILTDGAGYPLVNSNLAELRDLANSAHPGVAIEFAKYSKTAVAR